MSLMYAQMGLAAVNAWSSYEQAKSQAKMAKMQRDYQNTIQAITAAQSLNSVSRNEIEVRDAGVRSAVAIEEQALKDRASAEVSAAAAGVKGDNVNSAMRALRRSSLRSREALRKRIKGQAAQSVAQRSNILVSKAVGKDTSVVMQPSATSALLGLGVKALSIYDEHQPPGSTIADRLATWGRSKEE